MLQAHEIKPKSMKKLGEEDKVNFLIIYLFSSAKFHSSVVINSLNNRD